MIGLLSLFLSGSKSVSASCSFYLYSHPPPNSQDVQLSEFRKNSLGTGSM